MRIININIIKLLFLLTFKNSSAQESQDDTLDATATGKSLVDLVLRSIEAQSWYETEWNFLLHAAIVESDYGTASGYDPTPELTTKRGIWGVTKTMYDNCGNYLASLGTEGLDWTGNEVYRIQLTNVFLNFGDTTHEDCSKPIISAAITFCALKAEYNTLNGVISLEDQALAYEKVYDSTGNRLQYSNGIAKQYFQQRINSFLNEQSSDIFCLIDLALVLDSSGSVSDSNFEISRNFARNITSTFNINGTSEARVGVIQYSGNFWYGNPSLHSPHSSGETYRNEIYYYDEVSCSTSTSCYYITPFDPFDVSQLHDCSNNQCVTDFIDDMDHHKKMTTTAHALKYVMSDFYNYTVNRHSRVNTFSKGARSEATQVVILLTDGSATDREHINHYVEQLDDYGIIRYSIGVGQGADSSELRNISSSPSASHMFLMSSYSNLHQGLSRMLHKKVCQASSQQDSDSGAAGDAFASEIVLSGCQSKSYHFKCEYRAFEKVRSDEF